MAKKDEELTEEFASAMTEIRSHTAGSNVKTFIRLLELDAEQAGREMVSADNDVDMYRLQGAVRRSEALLAKIALPELPSEDGAAYNQT